MKNETRFRSLDFVETLPQIETVYQDIDGIWIEPAAGWTCDPLSAHGGHVDRVRDAVGTIRAIRACDCAECAAARKA